MKSIYLDYNATTPIDPAVIDAMSPYLCEHFGNPSSGHVYGKAALDAVERARGQVAAFLGAQSDEIVFTGGGSEASNHALKGIVFAGLVGRSRWGTLMKALFRRPAQIVLSAVEHPATAEVCRFMQRFGCPLTVLPVDCAGQVDPEDVRRALRRPTAIVSVMHANNEVGTLQPIAAIGKLCKEAGVPLHTDAAQSLGKVAVDVNALGVDLLTVAGHKLYAPKGVGALYVRRGVPLEPLLHGAGHEMGRRAGTENVPYLVGLGAACEIAGQALPAATAQMQALRDRLWNHLRAALGERVVLNGHVIERLPNTLNVAFVGCVGSELLAATPEVAASTGSACHEGKVTQSAVLCAMGVPPELGRGAVRISVGRFTTEDEVDEAAPALLRSVERLKTS